MACRSGVLRAMDIFLGNGVFIDTGLQKHAVQQTPFLNFCKPATGSSLPAPAQSPGWRLTGSRSLDRNEGPGRPKDRREFPQHGTLPLPQARQQSGWFRGRRGIAS